MKKIYNTPSVKVVILNASPILVGSNEIDLSSDPIDAGSSRAKGNYRFDLVDEDFD